MTDKVSTIDVRQRLGDMLNRVALRNDEFIIERKGKALDRIGPGRAIGTDATLRPPARPGLSPFKSKPCKPSSN